VRELGKALRLVTYGGLGFLARQVQQLEGDLAVDVGVAGSEHDTHAAATKMLEQLEATELDTRDRRILAALAGRGVDGVDELIASIR
jgi:hypothetical protein